MENCHKMYYEQPVLWNRDFSKMPAERERIEEIIKIIPPDTHSVLDVGCGNGYLVNTLIATVSDRFDRVTGLDSSTEALKYVKSERLQGSITKLPFDRGSFDLLTCLEVLEHLPQEDFKRGICELQRVSRKYIIVTVPNDQELRSSQITCPECHCVFHPNFHMRRFDKSSLKTLFRDFKLIKAKEIGPTVRERCYGPLLLILYRSWISIKKRPFPAVAICPQCGYGQQKEGNDASGNKSRHHILPVAVSLFRILATPISRTRVKGKWLLALYEKAGG